MKILTPKVDRPLENHFVHAADDKGKPVCGNVLSPYAWILQRGKKQDVTCRACKKEL